ncbi:MAG TPA: DUF885 family protein, partial [Kofleriaceae bacterium]|nr:DUF885 family protein [Kofleriaceae bacterium]
MAQLAEAAAGVESPELAQLLREHWDWTLERSPVWATTLGDHRFDDQIEDNSAEAIASVRARTRELLARARKLPADSLGQGDRITLELFIGDLESSVATEVCDSYLWNVSVGANPIADFNVLPEMHTVKT